MYARVLDEGYRVAHSVRGNSFRCQCPAHGGSNPANAVFFLNERGNISFKCYSRDCKWQEARDALDLTNSDFLIESDNPLYQKKLDNHGNPRDGFKVDLDEVVILCAEHDIAHGIPISDEDLEHYKRLSLKKAGLAA